VIHRIGQYQQLPKISRWRRARRFGGIILPPWVIYIALEDWIEFCDIDYNFCGWVGLEMIVQDLMEVVPVLWGSCMN